MTGPGSSSGSVRFGEREVTGSIQGRDIPVSLKMLLVVISCSSLGSQTYGVELGLVDPVSGYSDWVWYHVKCLVHDTSVRQHYKSEHWAPCHNQTPLLYDWKIVESDVKPKQTTTTTKYEKHAKKLVLKILGAL